MEKKEKENSLDPGSPGQYSINLKEWFKRDFVYIIVCLAVILVCLLTLLDVGNYQEKCNTHWINEWNESGCGVDPDPFNTSYSTGHLWDGGLDDGIKDQD